ncbi:MAG: 30S ribosomal protein S9 [Bifidobacterium mongoliense]|jgi:small subunit ribosomal protein S9|uniref:Small ribosomal subunit protein uS9 n=2 Tax=Bifidobacterium mongoliense TaxID=518643 RepID=A0A087BTJ1_9BIFI|nr:MULTISPECIES: 30S ribosomal protein S9 [Actinomycetes]KFI74341.1 30S ribosomal protein S9 [Bifidobacterium mongoliense DSM 21395]MDN5633063.1 30S ribosomal protein S9 [Bifidobacterium mongoliense]MDN5979100.1 30S ribosomal protein S9 [Bifidobacterium mongoliense]MDN6024567.1 30S ribosomal protein S9 [Bifidobacterium mongoliense]MDN6050677.1 30S ribosomal protein S9 [Bifidobacterium mongoliense]
MAENTENSTVQETEEELTEYSTETNAGAGTGTSAIEAGYGTGRRKEAVARVRLIPGTGKWTVNGHTLEEYFPSRLQQREVNSPIVLLKLEDKFDSIVLVEGGGTTGQAGAIRLGVARALNAIDRDANRATLKKAGFLTRDARAVERKKAGLHKARRAPQFSKR